MTAHTMRYFTIFIFVVLAVATSPASEEYAIRGCLDANTGKHTGYFISRERVAATPEWVFDGITLPPLSLPDAYRIASQWIAQKYPKIDSFRVRSYSVEEFVQALARGEPNRWYYSFEFIGSMDGTDVYAGPFTAMVLMDGTVIEPREVKPDGT